METRRAAAAGAIATGVTTALWLVEPSIGLPRIAVGQLLSTMMSVTVARLSFGPAAGWLAHVVVGIVLALIYAAIAERLPGTSLLRGALYGAAVFVLAQLLFMPLVGGGFFSGGEPQMLVGSLAGHLVYGIVLAWIYDLPRPVTASVGT